MHTPLLSPDDRMVCRAVAHHVEPKHGYAHASTASVQLAPGELLMIGRDPELRWIRDETVRGALAALSEDGRRVVRLRLATPPGGDTHVSAVQAAVWFTGDVLMGVGVGRNAVDVQGWGQTPSTLSAWPGAPLPQLTTLWLPLTHGNQGNNLRWRVALAFTGPDERMRRVLAPGRLPSELIAPAGSSEVGTGGPPSGRTGAPDVNFGERQRVALIERFQDWLGFPARTYEPTMRVLVHRPDWDPAARDTRMERLETLRDALARATGFAGLPDERLVATLLSLGALRPDEVRRYPQFRDIDLELLAEWRLLR